MGVNMPARTGAYRCEWEMRIYRWVDVGGGLCELYDRSCLYTNTPKLSLIHCRSLLHSRREEISPRESTYK